jgi:hypothetical protein
MIEYLSPAVLTAVLRVSSTPIFSVHLALASLLKRQQVTFRPARAGLGHAGFQEGKHHV